MQKSIENGLLRKYKSLGFLDQIIGGIVKEGYYGSEMYGSRTTVELPVIQTSNKLSLWQPEFVIMSSKVKKRTLQRRKKKLK